MKRCNACGEEFEDKFRFCPVDATSLIDVAAAVAGGDQRSDVRGRRSVASHAPNIQEMLLEMFTTASQREFHLTIIDNTSLPERLRRELRFVVYRLRQAWPVLKRDPVEFGKRSLAEASLRLRSTLTAPGSLAAIATAVLVVISGVLILLVSDQLSKERVRAQSNREESAEVVELLPNPSAPTEDQGVGAGNKGRVGFRSGKAEGSAPESKKSTGGGSGGDRDPLPVQVGKIPPPSEIPASIPKFPPTHQQTLPVAGVDLDPALWKNLPMENHGHPRPNSSTHSNGPGHGGGMGTTNGSGIGEGLGPGFGPGQDGNMGGDRKGIGGNREGGGYGNNSEDQDRVYPALQVTERARVLAKPEPQYTEEARRNLVMGTVVLGVVFSRNGEVTNIRALHALPFGLTEKAIAAARLIRFRPATKDGRPVNVYMQLEYNFNLY